MGSGKRNSVWMALTLVLVFAVPSLAGDEGKGGHDIHGYIGRSSTEVASGVTVILLDGESEKPLSSVETNFMGKYKFKGLAPGYYRVRVGDVTREIVLEEKDKRLDIDLSAVGGAMDYSRSVEGAGGASRTGGSAAGSGSTPSTSSGPNNTDLARQIAGTWWGYTGSTETRIGLCPDGTYTDFSESSYSGQSYDQYGDQTMAWGNAGQRGGSGTWTIQGDTQSGVIQVRYNDGNTGTIRYEQTGEAGCLRFDGRTLCRTSAACE